MKKIFIFSILLVIFTTGCSRQSDQWVGFFYPEGEPTLGAAACETKEFDTETDCKSWADELSAGKANAAYFCGYACNYDPDTCQYACNDAEI